MEHEALNVGPRMRALREQSGLSLRALAEACDLSVNAIAMIERGESSPRVSSLHLLARALNVRITEFFEDDAQRSVVFVAGADRRHTANGDLMIASVGTGLRNQQLEPFMVTLRSGAVSGEPVEHPGQEFVLCLAGRVDYTVGDEIYRLDSGDSLLFEATRPHAFGNAGTVEARLLIVLQSCEGVGIGRARHLEG